MTDPRHNTRDIFPPTGPLRVVQRPRARLRLRARDADGEPIAEVIGRAFMREVLFE